MLDSLVYRLQRTCRPAAGRLGATNAAARFCSAGVAIAADILYTRVQTICGREYSPSRAPSEKCGQKKWEAYASCALLPLTMIGTTQPLNAQ